MPLGEATDHAQAHLKDLCATAAVLEPTCDDDNQSEPNGTNNVMNPRGVFCWVSNDSGPHFMACHDLWTKDVCSTLGWRLDVSCPTQSQLFGCPAMMLHWEGKGLWHSVTWIIQGIVTFPGIVTLWLGLVLTINNWSRMLTDGLWRLMMVKNGWWLRMVDEDSCLFYVFLIVNFVTVGQWPIYRSWVHNYGYVH